MRRRLLCTATTVGAVAGGLFASWAGAVTPPPGFVTSTELTGLTRPSKIVWAPDGRRFVAEKDGVLKVAPQTGTTAQPVLDIRTEVASYNDRGLLGLALDTDFADNGYVYLLFTYDLNNATPNRRDTSPPMVSQLRRYTIDTTSQVVPGSMRVLLGSYVSGPCPAASDDVDCIPADGDSHSIGTVISAPDGTLFLSNGDGAAYTITDPLSLRTYDERSMAGKIMHVDRDGRGLAQHPFCPAETNLDRVCTKLYAKGFRNPFRFSLLATGALVVGDVGWGSYEEINVITAGGKSFGWPCYEGPIRTPGWKDQTACQAEYAKEGTASAHVAPTHAYEHTPEAQSWAVIVGPEYTGTIYPSTARGIYFGDYGAGFLKRLVLGPAGQPPTISGFATDWGSVDLTSAPNGDITWVDLADWGGNAGFVERLVYSPGNANPTALAAATPTSGSVPLEVDFDGSGSEDDDGDPLTYSWDFGDGSVGSGAAPTHTYTSPGSYTATLTVSDGRGLSDTDTVQINAANNPPVPTIELPRGRRALPRRDAPHRERRRQRHRAGLPPRLGIRLERPHRAPRPRAPAVEPHRRKAVRRDPAARSRRGFSLRHRSHRDRRPRRHGFDRAGDPPRDGQAQSAQRAGRRAAVLRRRQRHGPLGRGLGDRVPGHGQRGRELHRRRRRVAILELVERRRPSPRPDRAGRGHDPHGDLRGPGPAGGAGPRPGPRSLTRSRP